jgi:hypothetical protein
MTNWGVRKTKMNGTRTYRKSLEERHERATHGFRIRLQTQPRSLHVHHDDKDKTKSLGLLIVCETLKKIQTHAFLH